MEIVRIRSVSKYVAFAVELREKWSQSEGAYFDPWFRGHANAEWELQPNLYRLGLDAEEDEIRLDFKRRGTQLLTEQQPGSDWAWYFLMQHHGAPTRLLDWTDSALVALFFAVNSGAPSSPSSTDAAVWALNPFWLNRKALNIDTPIQIDWPEAAAYLKPIYQGELSQEWPAAIDPAHIARRIAAQFGRFTVHGTNKDGLTALAEDGLLQKIIVPAKHLDEIRTDLRTCGIIDTSVFPDLDALSRDLVRFWLTPWSVSADEAPRSRRRQRLRD